MLNLASKLGIFASVLVTGIFTSGQVSASPYQFSVVNNQPSGGFAITPVWFGLSNGSFSAFSTGQNLTGTPYQAMAELGSASALTSAFNGVGPQITVGGAPLGPAGTGHPSGAVGTLDIANPSANQFLNYASMVVPSNAFFFGNDSDHQVRLFNNAGQLIDAGGNVTLSRTIQIFGSQVWDAGTEVNNIDFGAAFIVGDNASDHVAASGTAQLVFGGVIDDSSYLSSINGKATPYGYNISHVITSSDLIATITISSVPEPSSISLAAIGLAGVLLARHRNRRAGK